MSLTLCLLPDEAADRAIRALWQRLEDDGVPTLLSHTHGRHVPHLTLASLTSYDLDAVRSAVGTLPAAGPYATHFHALGMFRRSRCWLAPAVTSDLLQRQERAVATLRGTGTELHRNYEPGDWLPHLTLAPRLHLRQLTTVAEKVNQVLPLPASFDRAALVQTSTGEIEVLPRLL